MKNIRRLLIFAILMTSISTLSFAAASIQVSIDGNPIVFNTQPEMVGSTLMVPMKEFFEAMGARVLWVESEHMVIAYKDNMHMKLQIGNNIAFRNGKRFTLDSKPYIRNGHTMVPIQIIAETFDMLPVWSKDKSKLNLAGSDDEAGLKLFDDGIYKTKPIDELGITISIPYHWENLDGQFHYGYEDDFESYSVTLMSQKIDKTISLSKLVADNKAMLLDAYDENITFTGEEVLKIDNLIEVRKLFITTRVNKQKKKQVLYILKQNGTAYFMTCHYGSEVPEEDIIAVFDNVISTFKIRNLSIDSEEEHYVEFEDFYELGVQLNQEYYSNMVIEKSVIPFSGTLDEGHGLESFKVTVASSKDSLDFIIPIAGNAFDAKIYTPFGLGKHNIFITGISSSKATASKKQTTTTANASDGIDALLQSSVAIANNSVHPLLQFSVINIDARVMRYLIPTNVINSTDIQIDSTARLLTYQVSSQYMKARELYSWMIRNIGVEFNSAKARTNYQVFDDAIGTPEQVNQLYVAYLRALEIPARVVKGTSGKNIYYWTELYLNGTWVTSDLLEGILLNEDESSSIMNYLNFNLNLEEYRSKYDLIKVQPY